MAGGEGFTGPRRLREARRGRQGKLRARPPARPRVGGGRGFGDLRVPKRRSRREHWRHDVGPRVGALQEIARRAYRQALGGVAGGGRGRELPGHLDQHHAAAARCWHRREARRIRRAFRRAARARGVQLHSFRTTVEPVRWQVEASEFDPERVARMIPKWRKQAQRWARDLPPGSFACGVIEAALIRDETNGRRFWAFHMHLAIEAPCRSRRQGRKLIRQAFCVKNNEGRGVRRAVVSKRYRRRLGGVGGWLQYMTKAFQVHGVHGRVAYLHPETGKRRLRARRYELGASDLAPWAALVSRLCADDLMVWVGYRRRGNRVVPVR